MEIEWMTKEEEKKLRLMIGDSLVDMQKKVFTMMKNAKNVPIRTLEQYTFNMNQLRENLKLVELGDESTTSEK